MHFVYVLKSLKDGKRYIGLTNDIPKRLQRHNDGEVSATKGRRPFILIHSEQYKTRSEAARREIFLKSGKGREELDQIVGNNVEVPAADKPATRKG